MSKSVFSQKRWAGGLSDYLKENASGEVPNSFYYGRAINYRDDPQSITLLPGAVKESGSVITDLIKWGDVIPSDLSSYYYGDTGNLYKRTTAGSWSLLRSVANAHGNGLSYFAGDDYLYYTTDSALGRYGPIAGIPTVSDNFLQAQGGVPLNTNSLLLASASSMYATASDSASLSVTGSITLETFFKANTLPTAGNSMALIAKWDESGVTRSYILDLYGTSGFFGDGSDGPLTISSNTTQSLVDSDCTGTAATQSISATNASFAANKPILIWQTQGSSAGQWERNTIQSYTSGTITTMTPLRNTYGSGAQVIQIPQYTTVSVSSSFTWSAKSWNGTTGGLLIFLASGNFAYTGIVSADGAGFRGGVGGTTTTTGNQGESYLGGGGGSNIPNYSGGGGGDNLSGNGFAGLVTPDSTDLTTMILGSGGGGANTPSGGTIDGGNGGGGIFVNAVTISRHGSGTMTAGGVSGSVGRHSAGSGSGGFVMMNGQVAPLGVDAITALGAGSTIPDVPGEGGNGGGGSHATLGIGGTASSGGAGGDGRIHLNYLTSYSGSTIPTLNATQDNTLVTTTTTQARLGVSSNGSNSEYLTQNLSSLATGVWNRLSASWVAATSTVTFYLNALVIGTSVGTFTSIHNNASLLYVGANKTSAVANFFDGYLDDARIWGQANGAGQIAAQNQVQLTGSEGNLKAYYKLNAAFTDGTANGNTLTSHNSPTFSTDVPFPAPSTRLDIDTSQVLSGQTYTLPTSIIEDAIDIRSFTPVNDPQASVSFFVDTKGTGNWTVTIHDQQNRTIATTTMANANIPIAGEVEFIFTTPWRIVIGKTYHIHLTSTVADGKIVTGTADNISTAKYYTYFGFLVTDTQFHPIVPFLQYEVIGNERYLATWDGAFYNPNLIAFPPQWKVRCFGFWREYLAIGMWRGGLITGFDRGRIYFWDGQAPTFNFFIDIAEGQVNALCGIDSDLYMYAGYRGLLMDYQGNYASTGSAQSQKVKRMPQLSGNDYTEVYPGALTMWRGLLHAGLYANSNSTTVGRGVYSYGTLNQMYPQILSFDYPISTGNYGSTVQIGSITPVGTSLVVGWKDGSGFGADKVDFNNNPARVGELQTLVMDDNSIWHQSETLALKADFLPLTTGQSVEIELNLDRNGFTSLGTQSTISKTSVRNAISSGRAQEYQLGVKLFSSGTTSPTLLGLSLLKDELTSEGKF